MTRKRSIVERFMPLVSPTPVVTFAPPPRQIDERIWVLDRSFRMPGGPILPTRTTIIALPTDELLVISPPSVDAGGLEEIDALGAIRHVAVPNSFHHLNAPRFLDRYPGARFWAAPGLFSRIRGLPPGNELSDTASDAWSGAIDLAILRPTSEVSEVALFHRPSATLILTDVAFHMVQFASSFERMVWRLSGVPAGFGPSRTARMLLLHDRAQARAFLDRLLSWPFRRILVAHGEMIEENAAEIFRHAFAAYLGAASRMERKG